MIHTSFGAGEAMKEQGERKDFRDNVTEVDGRGNSRAYSIDRVKRECDQDTVDKVMSGKLSPNAALVKSGIRVNRQVYIPTDPKKLIPKLAEKFGNEYVKQAIKNL